MEYQIAFAEYKYQIKFNIIQQSKKKPFASVHFWLLAFKEVKLVGILSNTLKWKQV